jgi:DNA-binding NarL/FixJ family response regulator
MHFCLRPLVMPNFADLTVLLIDPHAGMRASMHHMLTQCGIAKIEHAVTSGTAISSLKRRSFDLVLCEYDLGDGQDGQQLLEDLRHHHLIPQSTIFFMVTAECSHRKVVSAAELAPAEYILKPFTADIVLERVSRAVERRALLLPIYNLIEQGNLRQAIETCAASEVLESSQTQSFTRLRAELYIMLGEATLAETIYSKIFDSSGVAWARLGLAKSLFMQQRLDEAATLLATLVHQNIHFLEAYDWLAKTYEATGDTSDAQTVLQNATAISPHAVQRLRKLGSIALQNGDLPIAEQAYTQVISKARFSEFRDPEDHVHLVHTLLTKGDSQQAANVIRDLDRSVGTSKKGDTCRALSAGMVHAHTGDTARATDELGKAVDAYRGSVGISDGVKMTLAQQCLTYDLDAGASEIMLDVMSNASDQQTLAKAKAVFEKAGRHDLADSVSTQSKQRVIDLVASGAEKAKQGDYRGAVTLMTQAVQKLPDNPQVVFNAAVAVLKYLEHMGWDRQLGEQARTYIDRARQLDPSNVRLVPLAELYHVITRKYNL